MNLFHRLLTVLLIFGHAHDVHGFPRVLKLLGIIDSRDWQISVGQELVGLGILDQKLLLGVGIHAIQHLVEDVEGALIRSLTDRTRLLKKVWWKTQSRKRIEIRKA